MLTFEKYQKRKAEYLKAITEFGQMIDYRRSFLNSIHGTDDVYDEDLVIRSLRFLIEFNNLQLRYLDDNLEDPGAASDIVDSWLDSANHKYEFKFDGEED